MTQIILKQCKTATSLLLYSTGVFTFSGFTFFLIRSSKSVTEGESDACRVQRAESREYGREQAEATARTCQF